MGCCSFKAILDWIIFITFCVFCVFYCIVLAYNGNAWVDNCIIAAYVILASVFTGIAPFHWASFIDQHTAFTYEAIWRPCFIIIMACFGFPGDNWKDVHWARIVLWICSIILLILGLVFLIVDLIQVCQSGCQCVEGDCGQLLNCTTSSSSSSSGSKTTTTHRTTVVTKSRK